MRVFVEPSGYRWLNRGDAMMAEVALARLRARWPDAEVTVHTLNPEALRRADPRAIPRKPSRFFRKPRAIRNADLFLLSGAGSLNDEFRKHAMHVLDMLELAHDSGAVTAIVGQGLGPMSDRALRARAAEVLPRVDFIALREGIAGPALLDSFGMRSADVSSAVVERLARPPVDGRYVVTGDDAITLAYDARPRELGTKLGVNLRLAPYSAIGADVVKTVRDIARIHDAINITIAPEDLDADMSSDVLANLAQCRAVVAGSYHAAVLALSMGIPVVAIANNDYYRDKFRGLSGQFGVACRVLVPGDGFRDQLERSIGETFPREELLEAARMQIAAGEAAYRHIAELVEARRARTEA